MVYGLLLLSALVFFEVFVRLGTLAPLRVIFNAGPEGLRIISSPAIADDEKERILRRLSKQMFRATVELSFKVALAAVATALTLWAGALLLSVPFDEIENRLLSLPAIVGLLVVILGYAKIRHVFF